MKHAVAAVALLCASVANANPTCQVLANGCTECCYEATWFAAAHCTESCPICRDQAHCAGNAICEFPPVTPCSQILGPTVACGHSPNCCTAGYHCGGYWFQQCVPGAAPPTAREGKCVIPPQCTRSDGSKVPIGWTGRDTGVNYCATCTCNADSTFSCPSQVCPDPTCCNPVDRDNNPACANGGCQCCGASGQWVTRDHAGQFVCDTVVQTGPTFTLPFHTPCTCKLQCGKVVEAGYNGLGEGPKACATCSCDVNGLHCDSTDCGPAAQCPGTCNRYTPRATCLPSQCYNPSTCLCIQNYPAPCQVNPCDAPGACEDGYSCSVEHCGLQCEAVCTKTPTISCAAVSCANLVCPHDYVSYLPPNECCQQCKLREQPCMLHCATEVPSGWRGGGEGPQKCNNCECNDGSLTCETKVCSKTAQCVGMCDPYVRVRTCSPDVSDFHYNAGTCACETIAAPHTCPISPCTGNPCDAGYRCLENKWGGCNYVCEPIIL